MFPTFTVCFIENVIINIYFYMDYLSQDEILIYIKLSKTMMSLN